MKLMILLFTILVLSACDNKNGLEPIPPFTAKDSLLVIDAVLDSMKVEMDETFYYPDDGSIIVCFPRSYWDISINQSNQISFRPEISSYNMVDKIVKFYSTNLCENDYLSREVLYNWMKKNQVAEELARTKSVIDNFEIKIKNNLASKDDLEILKYQKEALKDWEQIYEVFDILKVDKFAQPEVGTRINLYYPEKCKIKTQVLDSLFLGYYKVRELDAKIYFKESYAEIFWKATKFNDSISQQRLKVIKVLHPIQIVDKQKYPDYQYPIPPDPLGSKK